VQRRRARPTAVVQRVQIALQNLLVRPTLRGEQPGVLRLARTLPSLPVLPRLAARMVGYGPRPEHVRVPDDAAAARLRAPSA